MLQLGDLSRNRFGQRIIWSACTNCGKERWVSTRGGIAVSRLCRGCSSGSGDACRGKRWNVKNRRRGGTGDGKYTLRGYVYVRLEEDDFFLPMANVKRWVREHRLIIAQEIGRCLQQWEHVHHKNGIKGDNRRTNLQLVVMGEHNGQVKCPYCNRQFGIR